MEAGASRIVELDVREDLRKGLEPFMKIMQAVSTLEPDDTFVLYATFEPKPLFAVMAAKGFRAESEPLAGGDYKVTFRRR